MKGSELTQYLGQLCVSLLFHLEATLGYIDLHREGTVGEVVADGGVGGEVGE